MESNNPANEKSTGKKSTATPFLIISLLWLCATGVGILFCGGVVWYSLQRSGVPPLFASPVPTVDIVQQISTDPSWTLTIEDKFTGNSNKWDTEDYQSDNIKLKRKIENGKYTWDFQAKAGWRFWVTPNMKSVTNFVASAEFQHAEGSHNDSYGLILRDSGSNHYYFKINERGQYAFTLHYLDEYTILQEGFRRDVIKPGEANLITVKAEGAHFTLFVNNFLIGEVENDKLKMGRVGIILSPSAQSDSTFPLVQATPQAEYPSRFEVDNFKVWTPSNKQNTDKSETLALLEPRQGRIVFVSDRDGNREVYTIKIDGDDLERLTNNVADDYAPKWSPNGRQIVFVSERDGNPEIYVMNRNGSDITRLIENPADDSDPSWSPDGQKIVFASNRDGNYNLYILDPNTKTVERITDVDADDRYPDWSPKKDIILFQADRDSGVNLYTIGVESRKVSRVTFGRSSSVRYPSWSPNGLSYVHEGVLSGSSVEIATRDFPNKKYFKITHSFDLNLWPAWSPDGTQIVFVSNRNGQMDIYIINKDGAAIYRLTDDIATESEVDWTAEE